jgi:hypothetical protein
MESLIMCAHCRLQAVEVPSNKFRGLRLFRCPVGHLSVTKRPTRLVTSEFRRTSRAEVWHFLEACSQWPSGNFVSLQRLASEATLCEECLANADN